MGRCKQGSLINSESFRIPCQRSFLGSASFYEKIPVFIADLVMWVIMIDGMNLWLMWEEMGVHVGLNETVMIGKTSREVETWVEQFWRFIESRYDDTMIQ